MLNDFSCSCPVYIACGYTDLRRGIDGLANLVKTQFQMDFFQGLKHLPLPGEIGGYRYPIFLAPLAYRQPAAPAGLHTPAPFRQPVLLISSL